MTFTSQTKLRNTLFLIFTLSGFAGLIYELIWTNYLKLFLGHAAYAQTLVLMIFMGGMALGAWLAGLWTLRIKHLLITYVLVEMGIGIAGFIFDPVFRSFLHLSYDFVIPHIQNSAIITLYKWSLSSLLILPQSILLGMTFPLMSNAIIRRFPEFPGSTLAMLYFTNSFGAAVGVLWCGFGIIPILGLPGALLISSVLNFIVAFSTYICWKIMSSNDTAICSEIKPITKTSENDSTLKADFYRLFILAAFITGLASFMYEIGWIRLLTLIFGAATHSFELMLSSFILGLALGGLWIKNTIDRLPLPIHFLSVTQMMKGLLALASLYAYSQSFNLMYFFMHALARTENGYFLFNLSSYSIAMLVMLPATFCAGMTLPLITRILFTKGGGEKAIGQVYAANTVGAIAGVFIAIHWIMPLFSLKAVIVVGALFDIVLGFILWNRSALRNTLSIIISGIAIVCLIYFLFFFKLNPIQMASGIFRTGMLRSNGNVVFQKDGKTATVTVSRVDLPNKQYRLVIATNGKPDASLTTITPTSDEYTQILMGALPLSVYPTAKTAAVIGFGSGVSSHTLLQMPTIESVDTIEIERAMTEGAKQFLPYNKDVFDSPKSHIHIQDAKVFFANTHKKYDLILSEPSNPWVSGVSSLFTDEFYGQLTQHLGPNGIFCQWLHTYEMNLPILLSMLKALDTHFIHYSIYAANAGDIIILASNNQSIALPTDTIFQIPNLQTLLARIDIKNIQDFNIRHIIDRAQFHPLVSLASINSDYFPFVDSEAVKARFLNQNIGDFGFLGFYLPFDVFMPTYPRIDAKMVTVDRNYERIDMAHDASLFYEAILNSQKINKLPTQMQYIVNIVNPIQKECITSSNDVAWRESLYTLGIITSMYLSPEDAKVLWARISEKACFSTMPKIDQEWLSLFEAISNRNLSGMEKESALLLVEPENIVRFPYLLGINLLSLVAQDKFLEAQKTWKQYQDLLNQQNPMMMHAFKNQYELSFMVLLGMMDKKE